MKDPRALVFVGAHPDDESFGMGGTLAQYAAAGVKVYYICGTRGEAGEASAESLKGYASIGDLRSAELACAARELGLTEVIYLGFRDSGMEGSADNKHPQALAAAPLEKVAGLIVKEFRRLKPEVVVTFDPIGGYRHPDHIAMHKAAVMAFHAAGDAQQFPGTGPALQPQKLYFHVFPKRLFRLAVRLMQFFGRDVRHFGRNKDIDLTDMLATDYPVHAVIRLKKESVQARDRAAACHASQLSGGPPRRGILSFLNSLVGQRDNYMRAEPPAKGRLHKNDLFEGIE
jgi:N-acetyl-1-D-myo-inositol-2-amino-2-deoxy-alpha-D-glucopyranoside deacetylase/mycothiol S-conjugate amidase